MNLQVNLEIKHIQDFRDYKVSTQKAATYSVSSHQRREVDRL